MLFGGENNKRNGGFDFVNINFGFFYYLLLLFIICF